MYIIIGLDVNKKARDEFQKVFSRVIPLTEAEF
jgi:hypothetical protein